MEKIASSNNDELLDREIGRLRLWAPWLLVSLIAEDPRAVVEAAWRFIIGKRVVRDFSIAERIIGSGKRSNDPTLSLLYSVSRLDPLPVDEPPPSHHVIRALLLSAQAGSIYATRQLAAVVLRHKTLASFRPQVLECMMTCAQKGDVVCNYELGLLHEGLGSKTDLATAVKYYRAAAEGGDTDAAYNLGLLWATGKGRRLISDSLGLSMLRRAARQGEPSASYEIGYLHTLGHPKIIADKSKEDREKAAARWYRRSAMAGQILGQAAYADCARTGRGTKKNLRMAAEFFAWSALQGSYSSLNSLMRCQAGLPKGFPVNTIARAIKEETALWWLPKK